MAAWDAQPQADEREEWEDTLQPAWVQAERVDEQRAARQDERPELMVEESRLIAREFRAQVEVQQVWERALVE